MGIHRPSHAHDCMNCAARTLNRGRQDKTNLVCAQRFIRGYIVLEQRSVMLRSSQWLPMLALLLLVGAIRLVGSCPAISGSSGFTATSGVRYYQVNQDDNWAAAKSACTSNGMQAMAKWSQQSEFDDIVTLIG